MTLLFLFFIGLFAGTVDAIAGGGGLISLPVLLSIGMPPSLAFGTNKIQGVAGTFVAVLKYYKHGYINIKKIYPGIIAGLVGSVSGSFTAQLMNGDILSKIVPAILLIILIYTVFSPRMGLKEHPPKMQELAFYLLFGFMLGFYDGFFGPGTGSFWTFALTFFMGLNLITATAYTKVFNLNSSLIATICFAIGGNIDYKVGLVMAAGQIIGGRLGAHLAITKGTRLIRPFFIAVVLLTTLTLACKNYGLYDWIKKVGYVPLVLMTEAGILILSVWYIKSIYNKRLTRKP